MNVVNLFDNRFACLTCRSTKRLYIMFAEPNSLIEILRVMIEIANFDRRCKSTKRQIAMYLPCDKEVSAS